MDTTKNKPKDSNALNKNKGKKKHRIFEYNKKEKEREIREYLKDK